MADKDIIDYTIAEEWGPEKKPLEIRTQDRILVKIHPDGSVEYGPGYTPDEAAVILWETLGRKRIEAEDRLLLFQHLEGILTNLGIADLQNERAQRRVGIQPTPENMRAAARTHAALERVMHQALELGRGLASRPGLVVPQVPERIPQQIAQDENNSYSGRSGLEPDPTESQ